MTVVAPKVLSFAGILGIVCGLCLIIDSAAFDLPGNEAALPNTVGVLVPVLGVLFLAGFYAVVRSVRPSRLLDCGYLLSTVGLVLVAGVDFTRTYAFTELDDDTVDALLEHGPTKPAFVVAGTLFVVGALLFGVALIRAGYGPAGWLYTITAAPSGFGSLLGAPGAVAQLLGGVAIGWLGVLLRAHVKAADAGANADVNGSVNGAANVGSATPGKPAGQPLVRNRPGRE